MKQLLIICLSIGLFISCNKNSTIPRTSVKKPAFVSDAQFESQVLNEPGLVVVDFWASWCGPCRAMDPVLIDLVRKYPDVKFVKVDTDKQYITKASYGINALPTIVFIKQGEEVSRLVGLTTEQTVINHINRLK